MALVHYTDNIPTGFGGVSYGPYIRIRPKYKDDSGIHAHEQAHAGQWWAWVLLGVVAAFFLYPQGNYLWYYALLLGASIHAVLYKFHSGYRLLCEVRAYKHQAGYYADDRRLLFAKFISTKYDLGISTERAYAALIK